MRKEGTEFVQPTAIDEQEESLRTKTHMTTERQVACQSLLHQPLSIYSLWDIFQHFWPVFQLNIVFNFVYLHVVRFVL